MVADYKFDVGLNGFCHFFTITSSFRAQKRQSIYRQTYALKDIFGSRLRPKEVLRGLSWRRFKSKIGIKRILSPLAKSLLSIYRSYCALKGIFISWLRVRLINIMEGQVKKIFQRHGLKTLIVVLLKHLRCLFWSTGE